MRFAFQSLDEHIVETNMSHFEVNHLTFSYPDAPTPALEDVTLDVEPGSYLLLCGGNGSGKTTLLRHFASWVAPEGTRSGTILLDGIELDAVAQNEQISKVGFVGQNPNRQITQKTVLDELALGPRMVGCDCSTMQSRIAETAAFFGIKDWLNRDVDELSGGQKRLLNLASAMVMSPGVLVLDEPTSRLDPIATSMFLSLLRNINHELDVTVIISERAFEQVYIDADEVIIMDAGRIAYHGSTNDVARKLYLSNSPISYALPSAIRIFHGVHPTVDPGASPVSIHEARSWMREEYECKGAGRLHLPDKRMIGDLDRRPILKLNDIHFAYGRGEEILRGTSLSVVQGSVHAIVGNNDAGKTTLLKIAKGMLRPDRGSAEIYDRMRGRWVRTSQCGGIIATLPQNLDGFFTKDTVYEELRSVLLDERLTPEEIDHRVRESAHVMGISPYLDKDPRRLSCGERRLVAITKVEMAEASVLILDEPTMGVDPFAQRKIGKLLHELAKRGITILIASQDIKFCAEYATSVSLLFNGSIATTNTPQAFFSSNTLYTTEASRISRVLYSNTVTDDEVIILCLENGWQKQ